METNKYYIKYPVLQIRPYGLLAYERREWFIKPRKKDRPLITTANRSKQNNADGTVKSYTGKLSPYAKKKLKRAIGLLVASAKWKEAPNFKTNTTFKFKVNFITLTLPCSQDNITDKQIKKECLDNFIKRLRRKHKLNSYVWRAEKQANGNLHFHMITDVWIHYEKIRADWNDCLQKFKMVDRYCDKHSKMTLREYLQAYPPTAKVSRESRVKSYKYGCATKWRSPNSSDVHAVWKIRNLTQYFVKYMTKGEKDAQTINGKLWDCSQNLKTKQNCETLLESDAYTLWENAMSDESCTKVNSSNFCLVFFDPVQFDTYITGKFRSMWEEYLARIRGDLPNT